MNELIRNVLTVALLGASSALTGCVGATFGGSSPGYDEQGCVEQALRRNPDKGSLEGARVLFEQGCTSGDAGACSALGVLYELGRGVAADPRRAAKLYRMACNQGNGRGCTNLGLVLEHGVQGVPAQKQARDFYSRACDEGERSGCANLGRLYKEGKVVPKDLAFASDLLTHACRDGETAACLDLAELVAPSEPDRALSLFVNACVAGEASACSHIQTSTPKKATSMVDEPSIASK